MKSSTLIMAALVLSGSLLRGASAQQSPSAQPDAPANHADEASKPEVNKIEQAREALRKAEAEHSGNTAEINEALDTLIGEELDEHVVTPQTLDEVNRELQIAKTSKGARSKEYMSALGEKVEVLAQLGRAAEARPLAELSLELAERELPISYQTATAADDLGYVCSQLGDFPCATRAYEKSIAVSRKISGSKNADAVSALNNLAALKFDMGEGKGAVDAEEEALALEYKFEPNSPTLCVMESNLGSYYMRLQDFDKALHHLDRAVEIARKNYGPSSSPEKIIFHNRANLFTRMGRFDEAWKAYEFSLSDVYNTADSLAATRAKYANSLAKGGNYLKAVQESLQSARDTREVFVLQARSLPERQALAYEASRPKGLDTAISVLLKHPDAPVNDIYQEVVRSRALVADEMARRQRNLNAANDPEIAKELHELDQARKDRLNAETSESVRADRADKIYAATLQMEKIERSLADRSVEMRNDERIEQITLEDVRRNLPEHSVLISYVAYHAGTVDKADPKDAHTPSYAAFVLQSGGGPIRVYDLGDAASINALIDQLRAAADAEANSGGLGSIRNERVYRANGVALRKRVWDPIAPELQEAHLVLVVADGNLNLIPFAGLPQSDGYMVEHGPVIHTISSERDLIPALEPPKHQGLFAIGSPKFALVSARSKQPGSLHRGNDGCDAMDQTIFPALPGTATEISDVASAWKRWNASEPLQLVTGDKATWSAFLAGATQSRVLHVATHAFLQDKHCGSGNPLLHAGFVFAGTTSEGTNSIVTAQQIASLDLSGVDWAVLSACNTGMGELHDGEGVLGLQRAFRVAGARSVIMTLWPVDDEAAHAFMHELYSERLSKHASTADAVWNSARTLLLARRAAGESTHPWYWAGFVGSGSWE